MIIIIFAAIGSIIFVLMLVIMKLFTSPKDIASLTKMLKNREYKSLINKASRILQQNPGNWQVRYLLGKAYLASGKTDAALSEFSTVSKTAVFESITSEIEFRNILSDLLFKFQYYDKAFEELSLLLKLQPGNPHTLFKLGQIFEFNNNTAKAARYYKLVLDIDSKYGEAYAALGLIMYRGQDFEEADRLIAKALQIDGENTMVWYYQGKIAFAKKDYAVALAAFEKASRNQSLRAKCYFERGRCYFDANDLQKAIYEFERAISTSKPESKAALFSRYLLAACYEKTRMLDKALEQWRILQKLSPGFRDVEKKLANYADVAQNDSLKEYLTSTKEDFTRFVVSLTDQKLNYEVASTTQIPDGVIVTAKTRDTKQWLNVRTRTYQLYFYRGDEVLGLETMQDCYDKMKDSSIDKIYVFTQTGFTKEAIKFTENRPFELYDKRKLEALFN